MDSDPYEQKLFQMFSSHDVASTGTLDEDALAKLCQTLELSDRVPVLIAACLQNADADRRVTFKGFKEGLLTLLGDADPDESGEFHINKFDTTTDDDDGDAKQLPKFPQNQNAGAEHNAAASPSREVSPKFVVAGKKYGRRSRPPSEAFENWSSNSDTDTAPSNESTRLAAANDHQEPRHHSTPKGSPKESSQKVHRSSSHSDLPTVSPRKRRPTSGSKLKRCASLPAQPKPLKRQDDKAAMMLAQRESSVESLGNIDFENLSHSLHDVWTDLGHATNNYLNQEQLERVCEQVGLSGKIARKVTNEVFENLGRSRTNDRISFADFIGLIHTDTNGGGGGGPFNDSALITSSSPYSSPPPTPSTVHGGRDDSPEDLDMCCLRLDASSGSHDSAISSTGNVLHVHAGDWPIESSAVPLDVIVDMWDTAGIVNPRVLLNGLGFRAKEVRISQLSLAIDDDLQGLAGQDDASAQPLLRASLALHKAEVNALQLAFRQLATQNRKLHANNRDINRRAALLAQEVDERHNHLESTARTEMRQLEQRHSDIVRDLTAQLSNDREHWTTMTAKLEQRIKSLESDDARLRVQCQMAADENSALEADQMKLQRQVTELLEENIRLNNELCDVGDRQRADDTRKDDLESEELLELMEKVSMLQKENSNLRDKNDELVNELEEKTVELSRLRVKKAPSPGVVVSGDADAANGGSATKRRGDSPSKARICEESPKLGKLRKRSNEYSGGDPGDSEGSGDWMALNTELSQLAVERSSREAGGAKDEEIARLRERIKELEASVKALSNGDASELQARVVELEGSLEQMRKEFEDLEDYWQGKLNDERVLYEADQRKSNEKFDELVLKMAEYEEQFVQGLDKDGRLSPIEEKGQLEQQYADLESEMDELRVHARELLESKANEVDELQEKVKRLQHRVLESVAASESASLGRISSQTPDHESPASSPISYLWAQSTIQAPARDYHNPNWSQATAAAAGASDLHVPSNVIGPIQRPMTPMRGGDDKRDSDVSSVKSYGTHSVASTHSIHNSLPPASPSHMREEIKQLKLFQIQLSAGIKELVDTRDCLVMEVQQLQDAKPALERAYTRTAHPSLMQRIGQLEQKNRNLQYCLKQQQAYADAMVQQSWQQQRAELSDMHARLEAQGLIISEQSQRLVNNDLLVKEFFVENAQLSERLEHQRSRNTMLMHGHQQQQNL